MRLEDYQPQVDEILRADEPKSIDGWRPELPPDDGRFGGQKDDGAPAPARRVAKNDEPKKSQVTHLVEISDEASYFVDGDGCVFAVVLVPSADSVHSETYPVRSTAYKEWLSRRFYVQEEKGCNARSVSDALATIEAKAKHCGVRGTAHLRVANVGGKVYLDRCDDQWSVIEIDTKGWRVLNESPVRFVRRKGMAELPVPRPGNIHDLRRFLNIGDEDFPLVVGWLVASLAGCKPYPVLVLQGEQGTGKSTTSRVIRSLVDPSTVPLRSPPKETRDLLVSAHNNFVVVLDNLSGLSPDISDCLCRLSTGGGIDLRQLYSDLDQTLVDIQRPTISNGIDDIATRPDLAERSIVLNLPVIDGSARRAESSFWRDFEAARPGILGALLTAVAYGLAHRETVDLKVKPRMADFAEFVVAAEPSLGLRQGEFMAAYTQNQDDALLVGVEASPLGAAVLRLMENTPKWTGTATQLLTELSAITDPNQTRSKAWPQSPRGATSALKRLAPALRRLGIEYLPGDTGRTKHGRFLTFAHSRNFASFASPASPDKGKQSLTGDASGDGDGSIRHPVTHLRHPESSMRHPSSQNGQAKTKTCGYGDANDGNDAYFRASGIAEVRL